MKIESFEKPQQKYKEIKKINNKNSNVKEKKDIKHYYLHNSFLLNKKNHSIGFLPSNVREVDLSFVSI